MDLSLSRPPSSPVSCRMDSPMRWGWRRMAALAGIALAALTGPAPANTAIWKGGGLTLDIADATNWVNGLLPTSGDTIIFSGASTSAVGNGLPPNLLINGITFDASSFFGSNAGGSFTLGGDIVDNSRSHTTAFSIPLTFNATHSVYVDYDATLNLGNLTDGANAYSLIKTGAGLLNLNGNNTLDGPLIIQQGTVSVTTDARLGNVPATATPGSIVLDGGALRFSGAINANRGIALGDALGGSGTLDMSSGTYNGVIADNGGSGTLIKTGGDQLGTALVLGGANTYTGATVINQGALQLNFAATTAPSDNTNILYHGNASPGLLILGGVPTKLGNTSVGGGVLVLQGKASVTSTQSFGGLTLNQGNNVIKYTGTGGPVVLNLGAITHNAGGNVAFKNPVTFTTTTANTNGILGGWATIVSGTPAWAANDGSGNIVAYTGYTTPSGTSTAPTLVSNAASNVLLSSATTGNVTLAVGGLTDVNTIQITDTAARTLDIGTGNTLRLGSSGAIWRSSVGNSGAVTIGVSGSAGTLTAGGAANTAGEINLIGRIAESGGATVSYTVNSTITDNGTGAVRLVISGTFQDNGTDNTGAVQLNAANSYTGGTYVNSGTLVANNTASLGTGTVTVMPGAQVVLNTTGTVLNDFAIAGNTPSASWTSSDHAALRASGVLGTSSNTITLLGDSTIGSAVATSVINSKITGTANVTFEGPGVITLTNTGNNYTGNTSIGRGTLQIGSAGVIPQGAGFGDVMFTGTSGTLDLNGINTTINGLASNSINSQLIITNSAATTATLTVGANNATAIFGGSIQDGASAKTGLTKTGLGVEIVTGASNTYSGGTTVSQGILQAGADNAFSPNSRYTVNSGGILRLGGHDATVGSVTGTGIIENFSLNSAANTLSVGKDNSSFSFDGVLQNGGSIGPFSLNKVGSGTFTVNGANTYTGGTTVSQGVLQAGSSSAFGQNSAAFVDTAGTLRLSGYSNSIGSLNGSGTVENSAASAATLTTGSLNMDATFSGTLQDGGSGSLGLTKNGTGLLLLSGNNSYTGATVINAGQVKVTGSLSGSDVTVNAGGKFSYNGASPYTQNITLNGAGTSNRAVLGGNGTFSAALTLTNKGDVLAPGNSPGILNFSNSQTWQSFSYDWEVNNFTVHTPGVTHDQITINGTLTLSGGANAYLLNVLSLTGDNSSGAVDNFGNSVQTWQILTTTGGISGFNAANWTLDTSDFTANNTGATGTFTLSQNGNHLDLAYTPAVVPEPSGALLIMIAGVLGILKRKRRA